MKKRSSKTPNKMIDCGTYFEICLYNVKNKEIARALIDKDDLEKVKKYKWGMCDGYVCNNNKKTKIKLHQLIIGKKDGLEIDHRSTNKLDNRKSNLRHCTHSQNCMNKKRKGYNWSKAAQKWQVRIQVNYKRINLGLFKKEEDAIKARQKGEQKYYKEFTYQYEYLS